MSKFLSKFKLGGKKKVQNIAVTDYEIRLVENNKSELSSVNKLREEVLPEGIIEGGKVVDEVEFFKIVKSVVKKWGILKDTIRFFVPDSMLIMRPVDVPAHLKPDEIKDHFTFEIGNTIHLPFEDPILDIHLLPEEGEPGEDRQAHLYAAPQDELMKYTEVFADAILNPISANVQPLSVYRYYDYLYEANPEKTYLFFDVNLLSINISIFNEHRLEFIRYQALDFNRQQWAHAENKVEKTIDWTFTGDSDQFSHVMTEQINEIEHLIDFYSNSVKQGAENAVVSHIVVLGDMPGLDRFVEQIGEQYDVPTTLLKGYLLQNKHDLAFDKFVSALGLSLEGGH